MSGPGPIVLFGSGETAANAQRVYNWLFRRIDEPIAVAVLETPAGFQPNSAQVAGEIARYVEKHLVNFNPTVTVVPARQRGAEFPPEAPAVLETLLASNVLLAGPGSPTYAVRQLKGGPAWDMIRARHRQGAALVFSSAATLAISRLTLPVYEIYKVGEELHWKPGLDLLGDCGTSAVFVSHWNNTDGGVALDTSRCYMGEARFARLLGLLPPDPDRVLLGIDEKTALCLDPAQGTGTIFGAGVVTVVRDNSTRVFAPRESFPLTELGNLRFPSGDQGIDSAIWKRVAGRGTSNPRPAPTHAPPDAVLTLAAERQAARARRDWAASDALREAIAAHGWRVTDTPEGPTLDPQ